MFRALLLSFLLCTLVAYLSACGFTPTYSKHEKNNASSEFTQIKIDLIPNQEGQKLRNILIDRFYQSGYPLNPKYVLNIAPIQEKLRDLDVTITSDTTRAQMKLTSEMKLIDSETDKILLKRSLKSITSYNVLGSEFATRVTEKNARDNAINDIARQIERVIILHIKFTPTSQTGQ